MPSRSDLPRGRPSGQVGTLREDQLRLPGGRGGDQPARRRLRDRARRPQRATRVVPVTPSAERPHNEAHSEKSLGRRAGTVAIWLVAVVVLALIGSAVLPRWWSHRIGDQVNGSITSGITLGLFYGFVFTFPPLALLRFTFRK